MMNYQPFSASAYGVNPGIQSKAAAGAGTPATSAGASPNDSGLLPWHPDSPTFWLTLIAGATMLGVFGAELGARVGKGTARFEVGKV